MCWPSYMSFVCESEPGIRECGLANRLSNDGCLREGRCDLASMCARDVSVCKPLVFTYNNSVVHLLLPPLRSWKYHTPYRECWKTRQHPHANSSSSSVQRGPLYKVWVDMATVATHATICTCTHRHECTYIHSTLSKPTHTLTSNLPRNTGFETHDVYRPMQYTPRVR